MLAGLIGFLGDFDLAEEAAQDAFAAAAERWPREGTPANPRAWLDDDRPQPRDRPHPPRSHARREDPPARRARGHGGRTGRDDDPGRAARARLHVLPSRARARRPGRADAADAGRPAHGRDRARVPGPRGDDGQAARPRQAQDQGGRDPVSRAAGPPAPRPARRGARGGLPRVQRGLWRARRPRGRGDPARARARRADARRARGARPARADAAERRPARRALRRRHGGPAPRPGSIALGPRPDRAGTRRARPRAGPRRTRPLRAPGGDRGAPRRRAAGLAADRGAVRRARARDRLAGGGAQPRRGDRGGGRRRGRPRPRGAPRPRRLPLPARHACGAAAPARSP